MEHIMEISHLHKAFGQVQAVQDLNFHVKKGGAVRLFGGERRRKIHHHQHHVR